MFSLLKLGNQNKVILHHYSNKFDLLVHHIYFDGMKFEWMSKVKAILSIVFECWTKDCVFWNIMLFWVETCGSVVKRSIGVVVGHSTAEWMHKSSFLYQLGIPLPLQFCLEYVRVWAFPHGCFKNCVTSLQSEQWILSMLNL